MVKISELDAAFDRYKFLVGLCNNAKERSCANPTGSFVRLINLPIIAKKSKNPKNEILDYFDELNQELEEMCFLDIVASFETMVFNLIGTASGEIKGIAKSGYKKPSPFHMSAGYFVKKQEDIRNLSGLKNLIAKKLPINISNDLSEILEHRNWIAHGKRIGVQSTLKITELYESLTNILDFICS